jgi:hypothetical protein
MSVRRAVLIAVVLHLSGDYCDPSIPGVFSFGAESFFVESVESRSSSRTVLPLSTSASRARDNVMPLRGSIALSLHVSAPVHVRAERQPYVPCAHAVESQPAAPSATEDH